MGHMRKTRSLKREGYSLDEVESMVVWERDFLIRTIIAERNEEMNRSSGGDGGYAAALSEAIVRKRNEREGQ